jgi:malate dehydrogenase
MSTVAILGAGTLGGALAHTLAGRDCVRTIRLIDTSVGIAGGKALDITQAGPVEGFDTRVTATEHLDAVIGAAVVVLTGPADTPENDWEGETAGAMLTQVVALNHRAPIVCAGASQASMVELGGQLGIDRNKILGTAPSALVSGLRALIALEADASPAEVLVNLVGVPPSHPVVPWSSATIGGYPLEDRLSALQQARLDQSLKQLWPPGPYTLASAGGQVITAMLSGGSRRGFACFVGGSHNGAARVQSAGVTVNATGVEAVLPSRLSRFEQVQLDNALSDARTVT